MMTVYQVDDWDDMASSMGDFYVAGTFLIRSEAEELAAQLNASARKHWMAIPNVCKENYRDKASVREVTVK